MDNRPGLNHLTKINSLTKLFNDVLKSLDFKNAYNLIYKMRLVHGNLIININKMQSTSDDNYFNISCMHSILYVINEKIMESEIVFNKVIKQNNIDMSTLKIDKSSKEELEDLPLFNGAKSEKALINEQINNEMKTLPSSFNNNIPSLLFFYNPQCPACVRTKPHWESITKNLKEKFEKDTILFNIMEFNLSDQSNEKLARLFKIEYIPTIIMMESANRPKALIEKIEGTSNNIRIQKFIKDSFNKFINK